MEISDTLTLDEFYQKHPLPKNLPKENNAGLRDDRPNIIFILVDDARWDSYSCNGAPDFFQTPNIDRIANEGVNFKNFFAVLSLCTPSRGVFFTGLYPHKTGAISNPENISGGIPWLSSILQDAGYYNILSGKLGFDPDSIRGFNNFMISTLESYDPGRYSISVGDTVWSLVIEGHTTDLIKEYAEGQIVNRPPDQPFFLYMAERAPHVPYIPRPQEADLFANDTMPYFNAQKYTDNFPSYYYPYNQAPGVLEQDSEYRGYFRMLMGVEQTLGDLFYYLDHDTLADKSTLMDHTVVMFSSDNGNLKSEHLLQGKQMPQEESIRLPMFIRYKTWFPEHKDIETMGLNVDWAKTIIDAAEIPDTYGMDGISMRELAEGKPREAMMYEVFSEDETPSMRMVRTKYFKYIKSFCLNNTEQLFDLVNDPIENVNLINDPFYQTVAQYYRCKLDSIRKALDDTAPDSIIDCKQKNGDSSHFGASENPGPIGSCIFPVWDQDTTFQVVGIDDPLNAEKTYEVIIYNLIGNVVSRENRYFPNAPQNELLLSNRLSPGLY
ncbi:MAG: sulfatase-like hydrolase/transferase, partial [Chitinophagales bacterium]|nr:sulfatase-like hydrolase/transferase [Chitinophagales bacterium]